MGALLPFRRPTGDPDEPTEPCPRCGAPVDTAAIECRRCGASTLPAPDGSRRAPGWVWLGVLLLALAVLSWLLVR